MRAGVLIFAIRFPKADRLLCFIGEELVTGITPINASTVLINLDSVV